MFCSPPIAGLSSSGTAATVTLASCEARAPIPKPASRSGTVTISAAAFTSMLANRDTIPANIARRARTTERGEAFGENCGIPAAAINRVIESGMILRPVSIAERPSATERYSGIVKKSPAAALSYLVFSHASGLTGAFVQSFAAGAVLTMLANTMMPGAFEFGGDLVGLVTVAGFVTAIVVAGLS